MVEMPVNHIRRPQTDPIPSHRGLDPVSRPQTVSRPHGHCHRSIEEAMGIHLLEVNSARGADSPIVIPVRDR